MNSTSDINELVKQANLLRRLGGLASGGIKGMGKGALIGGAVGLPLTLLTGGGLAAALGAGGLGMFSGAKFGGGAMGAMGALRGLLRRPSAVTKVAPNVTQNVLKNVSKIPPNLAIPRGLPMIAGAGLGYALSGEDNKLLGSGLGLVAGLAARPALVKALQRRAAGM
tara:strand:- start:10443 stop:10943 length:501 start_codon:yes stop_codon:yes gene_type:complete